LPPWVTSVRLTRPSRSSVALQVGRPIWHRDRQHPVAAHHGDLDLVRLGGAQDNCGGRQQQHRDRPLGGIAGRLGEHARSGLVPGELVSCHRDGALVVLADDVGAHRRDAQVEVDGDRLHLLPVGGS